VALVRYDEAVQGVKSAKEFLGRLDAEKAQFETMARGLAGNRSGYIQQMGRFGRHARRLNDPVIPQMQGVMDYALVLAQLQAQEAAWQAEVRRARSDYDDEQRRIREEEERAARRRREEEEAERRRRSSYSSSYSSSSSSSSSFGGGGFGGSSGSTGGGGFGGSSGSW
jgi:uncharacterized membrane protein YgcG